MWIIFNITMNGWLGKGAYTSDYEKARKFEYGDAMEVCRNARANDGKLVSFPVKFDDIEAIIDYD